MDFPVKSRLITRAKLSLNKCHLTKKYGDGTTGQCHLILKQREFGEGSEQQT